MSALRVHPRRHSEKLLAFARVLERVAAALGARHLYRRGNLARGRFLVRREVIVVPDLPSGLEGLCIAQLSDLHAGRFLKRGDLADVVAAVNAEEPDLVALTGDFISHDWSDALELREDLAGLRPRLASLAVFGNHDYRGRAEGRIAAVLAEAGIEVLRNEGRRFDTGAGALAVTGLEDLEEAREIDLAAARAEMRASDVEILLCHHPAAAPEVARAGCALILSGHTHGGQIDLPGLREFGPPHPGLRVEFGATTLLVSRGLGVVSVPLRVGAPTEVVCARLTRGSAR